MPRLLLIDDSLNDSARFMQILAAAGYLIEHLSTLNEGIERSKHKDFDAILLELDLPDSQGIATFVAARSTWPAKPIVVLTVAADDATVAQAFQHGAQDVLLKSTVTPTWLTQAVKHSLLRVVALAEAAPLESSSDESSNGSTAVVRQERIDDVVVLRILPRRLLDGGSIAAIEERLTSLVDRGNRQLVISLENVEYISNAALGVLIGVQKKIRGKNGTVHLASLRKNVRQQLGSRQFHRLFQIYDDVPTAIASLGPAS